MKMDARKFRSGPKMIELSPKMAGFCCTFLPFGGMEDGSSTSYVFPFAPKPSIIFPRRTHSVPQDCVFTISPTTIFEALRPFGEKEGRMRAF
jgi:hypothetical protein